jgi:hypothetical protein
MIFLTRTPPQRYVVSAWLLSARCVTDLLCCIDRIDWSIGDVAMYSQPPPPPPLSARGPSMTMSSSSSKLTSVSAPRNMLLRLPTPTSSSSSISPPTSPLPSPTSSMSSFQRSFGSSSPSSPSLSNSPVTRLVQTHRPQPPPRDRSRRESMPASAFHDLHPSPPTLDPMAVVKTQTLILRKMVGRTHINHASCGGRSMPSIDSAYLQ